MSTVNYTNPHIDLTVRVFDNFYAYDTNVPAAEYDIAVGEGGVLENEHEYQDALGFVRTAREWVPRLAELTENAAAVTAIEAQLDMLLPIWPGLKAPPRLETAPSVIYGAAARIEIAGLKV